MADTLIELYNRLVLGKPVITLVISCLVVGFFVANISRFELDASADSLILENDSALKYYRSIREEYGTGDFLIVTYSPKIPLFSPESLSDIGQLRDQLGEIEQVDAVISLLDVPLVSSPPMTLNQITEGIRTLESDDVDLELAQRELTSSALYQNLLVSSAGDITALQVNLKRDGRLAELTLKRDRLYDLETPPADHQQRLNQLSSDIKTLNLALNKRQHQTIQQVREIMDGHRDNATLYLGGVPMIVTDSIDFIRGDLKVFGAGVIAFIVLILSLSFRSPRWVVLPLITCLTSAMTMMGYLGWMQWPVTVVSSNFVSLLLIITLSLIIHLIVRYRELAAINQGYSQIELVSETVRSKFIPCVYTAVTTMVAFGSLLVSGIRPVIDFGWMMVIGISISFVLAFTLFPAALILMSRLDQTPGKSVTSKITTSLAHFIQRHTRATLVLFGILAFIGAFVLFLFAVIRPS